MRPGGHSRSLARLSKNRSTIVIAHRLSTIRYADEIIVLGDGAVWSEEPITAARERKMFISDYG